MDMYKKSRRSRTDRVTVAEAASRLGVKEQAIRKRIQRGTLVHDKDEHGRVYVYLDVEDQPTGTGIDAGVSTGVSTLVQSLQDQIAYLRQEAEAWKEEARRKDTIIMSLTQRIPELEVPTEPREAPDAAMQSTANGDDRPSQNQEPSGRRSWWRKFFEF